MTRIKKPDLSVDTPLGTGTLQLAKFARYGKYGGFEYLVRLPVTDEVRLHLLDRNCLTRKAKNTALFSFPAQDLGIEEQK